MHRPFAGRNPQYDAWPKTTPDAKDVLLALGFVMCNGANDGSHSDAARYVKLVPKSAAGHAELGARSWTARRPRRRKRIGDGISTHPNRRRREALPDLFDRKAKATKPWPLQPLATSGTNDETQALLATPRERGSRGRRRRAA